MKTSTQYREEIKGLRKSIGDIQAKITQENRDPLDEEVSLMEEINDKIEDLERTVNALERSERIAARLEKPVEPAKTREKKTPDVDVGIDNRSRDRFASFGQQLMAVKEACRPTGTIDPRLFRSAATGLGESIPSDGGFLVQQDFSSELLADVFQTGILAQRCRRVQISSNANSIKLNGVDETSRASTRWGGIVGYWRYDTAWRSWPNPISSF